MEQIQERLAKQITSDFHNSLSNTSGNTSDKLSLSQLTDACCVISVLEDTKVKMDLMKWFICKYNFTRKMRCKLLNKTHFFSATQLEEYQQLFHENEDIAWIAKIDKRYAWLKRHLLDFEERLGKIFPVNWEISERITVQFCHQTREALTSLMQRRRTEIDVKLLLFAISKTQQFEVLLAKRFNGSTFTNSPAEAKKTRTIITPAVTGDDGSNTNENDASLQTSSQFIGLISSCYEPFLDIYTDSVDRNLADLMERFVQESNAKVAFDPMINNSTVFPR